MICGIPADDLSGRAKPRSMFYVILHRVWCPHGGYTRAPWMAFCSPVRWSPAPLLQSAGCYLSPWSWPFVKSQFSSTPYAPAIGWRLAGPWMLMKPRLQLVSYWCFEPVSHKGLYQGWKQTSVLSPSYWFKQDSIRLKSKYNTMWVRTWQACGLYKRRAH